MGLQNLPIWNSLSVEQLCSNALTWNKNRSMDLFAEGTLLVIIVRLLPCTKLPRYCHKLRAQGLWNGRRTYTESSAVP